MKDKKEKLIGLIGLILLIIGIVQAVVFKWAHYYSFFSVGLFLVLYAVYEILFGYGPFYNWSWKEHSLFWGLLLIASVFTDLFGMDAGYWVYPHFSGAVDEIFKWSLEWVFPLAYLMMGLIIGQKLLMKKGLDRFSSWLISLIVVVTFLGGFTEYINLFVYSWRNIAMPLLNFKIGEYFILFQTLGYWTMAITGYLSKLFVEKML